MYTHVHQKYSPCWYQSFTLKVHLRCTLPLSLPPSLSPSLPPAFPPTRTPRQKEVFYSILHTHLPSAAMRPSLTMQQRPQIMVLRDLPQAVSLVGIDLPLPSSFYRLVEHQEVRGLVHVDKVVDGVTQVALLGVGCSRSEGDGALQPPVDLEHTLDKEPTVDLNRVGSEERGVGEQVIERWTAMVREWGRERGKEGGRERERKRKRERERERERKRDRERERERKNGKRESSPLCSLSCLVQKSCRGCTLEYAAGCPSCGGQSTATLSHTHTHTHTHTEDRVHHWALLLCTRVECSFIHRHETTDSMAIYYRRSFTIIQKIFGFNILSDGYVHPKIVYSKNVIHIHFSIIYNRFIQKSFHLKIYYTKYYKKIPIYGTPWWISQPSTSYIINLDRRRHWVWVPVILRFPLLHPL